jgi:hypothetical protein
VLIFFFMLPQLPSRLKRRPQGKIACPTEQRSRNQDRLLTRAARSRKIAAPHEEINLM